MTTIPSRLCPEITILPEGEEVAGTTMTTAMGADRAGSRERPALTTAGSPRAASPPSPRGHLRPKHARSREGSPLPAEAEDAGAAAAAATGGGERTKMGSHDIEDLISFGVDPHVLRGVAMYRDGGTKESIGLSLAESLPGEVIVQGVRSGTLAEREGTIRAGDRVVSVDGDDTRGWNLARVVERIRSTKSNPVMFDVSRGGDGAEGGERSEEEEGGGWGEVYSSHSACPYYLSHALSASAELVFAPYNYVLDPSIRDAMGIDLEGAVVVLDEAHNVEDTLRESGSCRFGELELCELLVMMNGYAIVAKSHHNLIDVPGAESEPEAGPGLGERGVSGEGDEGDEGKMYLCDVAHVILLFLEKVIEFLRGTRDQFEKKPGEFPAGPIARSCCCVPQNLHTT